MVSLIELRLMSRGKRKERVSVMTERMLNIFDPLAISEGHGDTALVLLKAGAESDKRDENDKLAIDLAPDKKVGDSSTITSFCA